MASDAIAAANGRWSEILAALAGLSDAELSDRHQPCPLCGGTDRYRFDDKDGSGSWFCNQCGGKDQRGGAGSGMDLLMRRQGWSFVEAARQVEAFLGLVPDGQNTGSGQSSSRTGKPWRMPEKPPIDAPPPPLNCGATAQWAYRNAAGEVLFWIQRIRLRSGGKAFLHRVWLDGDWHRPSRRDAFACDWPAPRPLYGLPGLGQRPEAPVLVVEGEGTADAAARLFPDHVVLSWANGSKAIAKADWTPLAGRSVTLWPDADAAGVEAMESLAALLHPLDCQLQLVALPADLPQGWDLADADWTPRQAARQLAKAAQPWTPPPTATDGSDHAPAAAAAPRPAAPFLCLGFDADANFYQPASTGQVIRLPRGCHTATHLVALAPLEYWETLYPSRTGVNWPAAASDLHKSSAAMGIFAVERIRGRGAWWDEGRTVLHLGDRLITPEGEHPITKPFSSRYIYQRLERQEGPCSVKPLTVEEAAVIVSIANRFRWEVPASGTLLQGWVVLAPICGALRWRPHLWLTAGAGSGKSQILDRFVVPLLGDLRLPVSGATTEAGLRQTICSDAMPVVFDEAESNEKGDQQRMQAILSLARVASSESSAEMLKGSPSGDVSRYRVRSMFLMSSIATALKQGADKSRFAQLTLRSPSEMGPEEREAHWQSLDRDLERYITPQLARRLIARTVSLIPVIRQSVVVFSAAAARHFDSQRLGDQYGTLMAGAWSLLSDAVPSQKEAEECIEVHNWDSYSQSTEIPDEARCIQTILQRQVRVETDDKPVTRTIGELVELAACHSSCIDVSPGLAAQTLGRHGLRVDQERLLVSNTAKAIEQFLADTAWQNSWSVVLLRLAGAQRAGPVRFCGAGMV
ncbi:MAG: primase-helicase zinc-binding domain-containing protein, partial [Cyanobium sp.]